MEQTETITGSTPVVEYKVGTENEEFWKEADMILCVNHWRDDCMNQ